LVKEIFIQNTKIALFATLIKFEAVAMTTKNAYHADL
jgi:hypothetical protein